jgi:uncharacterized protein (TIGR02996 family)
MSDEAAFLRAVRSSPPDDTARLVYADWLDDRDDPRGAYLRAEAEWARTGKKEKALRALGAALDPMWVARVSRPPVGICADKIVMRTKYPPATAADLDAVERRLKVTLPAEYRALLMNWNGASPSIGLPQQPPEFHELTEIKSFNRVAVGKKQRDRDGAWDLVDAVLEFRDYGQQYAGRPRVNRQTGRIELTPDPSPDFIPIAYGDQFGYYLLGVRGKAAGKVAYLDEIGHEGRGPADLEVWFPSLGALLVSIIEEVPEWYRHIKNGDTAGLLAWLDTGGDINARYVNNYDDQECLLTLAIGEKNPAMVRELRARGAKLTPEARRRAGYLRGSDKRKMRAALAAKPAPKKRRK